MLALIICIIILVFHCLILYLLPYLVSLASFLTINIIYYLLILFLLFAVAIAEKEDRTVFVQSLPVKASERQIREFFEKAGKVSDVSACIPPHPVFYLALMHTHTHSNPS